MKKIIKATVLSLALAFGGFTASQTVHEPFVRWDELELTKKQIDAVPKNFLTHHETFIKVMKSTWNDISMPDVIPALFEQETCYSLKHSRCWSTMAELKTDREYGFGLGQLTVTKKFNAWDEAKGLDKRLKSWQWEDRYDAEKQMIAGVSMVKRNYHIFKYAVNDYERFAFSFAAYNGGIGGIQSDQRICRNTKGCNEWIWFDNVEKTSLKQKTSVKGYGKSFFEINREHAHNIMKVRRFKYQPFVYPYFENVK